MEAVAEQKREGSGSLEAISLRDHDLVHELSNRLNTLWNYGECIANAQDDAQAQAAWRDLQRQELSKIRELKQLIASRIEKGEFLEDL